MFIFIGWSTLSATWAWQPELTWLRLTFILIAFITFCYVRDFEEKQKSIILWVITIQGGLLGILGVLQFLEIKPFYDILQTERPGLTMGHRNVAAEYVMMCAGAALSRVKSFKSPSSYLALFIALLCVGVILLTKCRGVILAMMCASLALLIFKTFTSKSKLFKIATPLFFCLAIGLSLQVVQAKFVGVQQSFSDGKMESIRMRIAHYSNTLVLVGENLPTGVGLGNFAIQYSQYLNAWVPDKHYSDRLILRNTHSDPLEVLAELGPIGLLLATMILWIILVRYKKDSWMQQALWWALVGQICNSCVNFPFQVIQTQLIVAIILGCFINKEPYGAHWQLTFPKRKLILLGIMACLVYNQFHHIQRIRSSQEARKGISYLLAKRPHEAEPFFRRAVELTPRQVDHLMLLAYALREMGRTTESSSIAENVLGIFREYLPAYNLIGLNALKINDLNRAVRAFEQSYKSQRFQDSTEEKLALSYTKLGTEFRKRGFIKQARELEHKLRVLYPEDIDSFRREALDLINLKQYDLALKLIDIIREKEDNEKSDFLEARVYIAKGSWVKALASVDKGLKKAPKDMRLLKLKSDIQRRFLGGDKK